MTTTLARTTSRNTLNQALAEIEGPCRLRCVADGVIYYVTRTLSGQRCYYAINPKSLRERRGPI
jgi:hypothetical protein